jgi:hypothetical protein
VAIDSSHHLYLLTFNWHITKMTFATVQGEWTRASAKKQLLAAWLLELYGGDGEIFHVACDLYISSYT